MRKIVIIGSGGAGKSTFARKLGHILNRNVYHLDVLFWKPNWEGVPRDEQIKIQNEIIQEEEWIMDGNYSGTMEIRLQTADTIIFLDISRTICLFRVIKRMIKYRNKTRPDMGEGCKEKIDIPFLKWVWNYPKAKRPEILKKLHGLSSCKKVIILRSPKEVQQFLDKVERK
ncbi:DNA topology modulation protein [Bacillus sp. S/N-304-OC-R1]|uniref:DNA topology modulation protein n=1 Tax=Bacillus sp. S/N-304-OC-R1 TaxID=2758034 RepID=UPI001C8F0F65|nr:DNA topology modulation protein [Bacillus sp. S/N-304-OC-R1]MBY0122012.1 DNA topology modulation protein [Bacillus sp. S/N-304-OC-R1]